jgi:hypothetical protein
MFKVPLSTVATCDPEGERKLREAALVCAKRTAATGPAPNVAATSGSWNGAATGVAADAGCGLDLTSATTVAATTAMPIAPPTSF